MCAHTLHLLNSSTCRGALNGGGHSLQVVGRLLPDWGGGFLALWPPREAAPWYEPGGMCGGVCPVVCVVVQALSVHGGLCVPRGVSPMVCSSVCPMVSPEVSVVVCASVNSAVQAPQYAWQCEPCGVSRV